MKNQYSIILINEHTEYLSLAVNCFHRWWGISLDVYQESMEASLIQGTMVPRWYIAVVKDKIIGGLGIVENDFHNRKDLAPNVCAVYVEKAYRNRGIAGNLLNRACCDMHQQGVNVLYLLTDHSSFYERYGWEYFCDAFGDGETKPSRIYIHQYRK